MAINFPDSPTNGQIFTSGSTSWIYDGIKWGLNTNVAVSNDSMPVGSILWFANTTTTPPGWIAADGSAVSRTTYATLFASIGTTYGAGDGSTTFNVPSVAATTGKYFIRYTTSLGTVTTTSLATSPVGTMFHWPTSSSYPTGFLACDGSAISRTSYADLFALIGTTYGSGDGSTTFNLPSIVAAGSGSPGMIIKASLGGIVEPSTVAHASSHIRGGSDIIDADRAQIDFVPTRYTRDFSASEAGANTDLTAHLKGIDNWMYYGMPVFTTEAARDAAITSPVEGMRAYITAPTIPATTGNGTGILPTGIQTIYNGTVWVCTTPVGILSANMHTVTSSTAANFLNSSSALTVTCVTGTTALVHIKGRGTFSTGAYLFVGLKTATVTPTDGSTVQYLATSTAGPLNGSYILSGLTAGTNTFTLQGWTHNGTAISMDAISIIIQGIA